MTAQRSRRAPDVAVTDKLLLSVWEAGALCGIGRDRAYALCRSGEWVSVRVGQRWLVPRQWLEGWIAGQTEAAEARYAV